MSHEIPQNNPYESVDVERPYLMPRNSGKIEVWHVETNEDGTPKVDDQGWIVLSGQNEELNAEGELSRSSKAAHPEALTDEVQGHFADILGQARPNATPEQFERYGDVNDELADAALEAAGIDEPIPSAENDEPSNEKNDVKELNGLKEKVEQSLKSVADTQPILKSHAEQLRGEFDAVMMQIHNGMSHDDSDRQAIGRYVAELDGLISAVNSMLSSLNGLKYETERLGSEEFSDGSTISAARDKLEVMCNAANSFMGMENHVLQAMRQFISAYDSSDVRATAEQLMRMSSDGSLEHHASSQEQLQQAFAAWE